jgi:hypothetical protein
MLLSIILRAISESVICLAYSIFESPSVRFVTGIGTGFHPPKAFDIERTLLCEFRLDCAILALIDGNGVQPNLLGVSRRGSQPHPGKVGYEDHETCCEYSHVYDQLHPLPLASAPKFQIQYAHPISFNCHKLYIVIVAKPYA